MASDLATATAPDWGLVLQTGLAGAAVIGLFWLGLHAMEPRRRNRRRNPTRRSSTHVQSLLFARTAWDPSRARAWARAHGYHAGKVDVTDNYVRLRQAPPSRFRVLRTVTFGRGIKAVVGR